MNFSSSLVTLTEVGIYKAYNNMCVYMYVCTVGGGGLMEHPGLHDLLFYLLCVLHMSKFTWPSFSHGQYFHLFIDECDITDLMLSTSLSIEPDNKKYYDPPATKYIIRWQEADKMLFLRILPLLLYHRHHDDDHHQYHHRHHHEFSISEVPTVVNMNTVC